MKRSRAMSICVAVGLAVVLIVATGLTAHGALLSNKKLYTADLSPHTATAGTSQIYTLTITNKASSQSLGSCNLTAPAGFALGAVTQHPAPGTAEIAGNVVRLRNMSIPPMGLPRTARFTATAPTTAGTYTWGIDCRQANNYSPDQSSNRFTLDGANSNLKTTVSAPAVNADIAITSHTQSQNPITGANTVVYYLTAGNNGPATSGALTLNDSVSNGGSITSTAAPSGDWACTGTGASRSCTHAALASGGGTGVLEIRVLAPNADTTMTNHAVISQSGGVVDPNTANNTSDLSTTVNKDSSCTTGQSSCGTGTIIYSLPSSVTSGNVGSLSSARPHVATVNFAAVVGAAGSQTWSLHSPSVEEPRCPISFAPGAPLTRCSWQSNLQIVPLQYSVGDVTFVGLCFRDRCPQNILAPGAGTLVVWIDDADQQNILPRCSGPGDTRLCFTQRRFTLAQGGHLEITVRNLPPGDPKVAGICIGGGC